MLLSREELEAREERELAPYAMKSKFSRGRKHSEDEHPYRGIYQRDRDRIIHSTAFRRLEYKTQVFVNHEGDYYRTRLTHTIEVAQISRSIARALNLNEDLVEAIALAHDVGHTPFGHSGEEALNGLMKKYGGFEHNIQALRVLDRLERRYPNFRGLNLSFEVREAILKHTTRHDHPPFAKEWADEFDRKDQPPLEAQVVEIADSIAYDSHDVDDGLKAGILSHDAIRQVELGRLASEHVASDASEGEVRAQVVNSLINMIVTDIIENTARLLNEAGVNSLEDVRKSSHRFFQFSPRMLALTEDLESFLSKQVYEHYRVARMARKAKRFVEALFEEYCRHPDQLPPEYQELKETEGVQRTVCDYIAGMTDRYAQDEYKKLFYPHERV